MRRYHHSEWLIRLSQHSFLPRKQTNLCCVAGSKPACDQTSVGCGGSTLMLANLYRYSKQLCAECGRGVNIVIKKN